LAGYEEKEELPTVLGRQGVYIEKTLPEQAIADAFCSSVFGIRRAEFSDLPFGYQPVPEVWLSKDTFDRFFPPRRHLSQLRDELDDINIGLFLEALGCHVIPDDRQRQEISSKLSLTLPQPEPNQRTGLVLICWERIVTAVREPGLEDNGFFPLFHVVCFHEHSHAARESRLLRASDHEILKREETIAQEETYMFLRSLRNADAIKVMQELMEHQPNRYRIRIP
jgi:hypothetical protein